MNEANVFRSIFLIEDDPGHALLIKRALKGLSQNVLHAETLQQAYQFAEKETFDLIISDLNLPDSTGVEHVGKLCEQCPDIPLVVLTSSTHLADAVEAMKLGARDYIIKDFDTNFREVLSLSLTRVYAARELEREKQKLLMAVERSEDGLAVVRFNGVVPYCNTAFQELVRLCGGKEGEFFSLFTDRVERGSSLKQTVEKALGELSDGAVFNTELALLEPKERSFEVRLSGIGSQAEGERECVVWVREITDSKRREKFQREILSTTTHDLKGPMGAIITGSELLGEMLPQGERPHEIALRMSSAAHGVVNLIDEFLSVRRIEEGTLILRPNTYAAQDLLNSVEGNFSTIAQSRSIELSFYSDDGVELQVDKLSFERVLGNLLTNALKFTPKEGQVSVRIWDSGEDVHVSVSDTGSGMSPEEVKKVFDRFSRLEKHDAISGTGLGLFVVKSLVSAHGGRVSLRSKVGEGSTFELSFPYTPPVNERGELISLEQVT